MMASGDRLLVLLPVVAVLLCDFKRNNLLLSKPARYTLFLFSQQVRGPFRLRPLVLGVFIALRSTVSRRADMRDTSSLNEDRCDTTWLRAYLWTDPGHSGKPGDEMLSGSIVIHGNVDGGSLQSPHCTIAEASREMSVRTLMACHRG